MKFIKWITLILAFLNWGSLSGQSQGSVNAGIQYYQATIKPIEVEYDFSVVQLAIGAEYKYAKMLSGAVYIGLLGTQGVGTDKVKFTTAVFDPIRLHFGNKGIGGVYFGPRLFVHSGKDVRGSSNSDIGGGLSIGFNILSSSLPISININMSGGYGRDLLGAASFTIGYLL